MKNHKFTDSFIFIFLQRGNVCSTDIFSEVLASFWVAVQHKNSVSILKNRILISIAFSKNYEG